MNATAQEIIRTLGLAPLAAEGGFFRQTWRGAGGSAILYLITAGDFSALHRVAQDEVWHFYDGDPVEHLQLNPLEGSGHRAILGSDLPRAHQRQVAVPAGMWQGARLIPAELTRGFALLGCTVTPPWEESGFELARATELRTAFPDYAELIGSLTA